MASRICYDDTITQSVEDDMESFLYVALYAGLHHLSYSVPPLEVWLMRGNVDQLLNSAYIEDGRVTGGFDKLNMPQLGLEYFASDFHFDSLGVNRWVKFVIARYVEWYQTLYPRRNLGVADSFEIQIHEHTSVRRYFEVLFPDEENWTCDNDVATGHGSGSVTKVDSTNGAPRRLKRGISQVHIVVAEPGTKKVHT